MSREIKRAVSVRVTDVDPQAVIDKFEYIPDQALMLAHHDDGIIWGRIENKRLATGWEVDPSYVAQPRLELLQQLRFFWETGEVHVWRDGDNILHARLIKDDPNDDSGGYSGYYDEAQILWGDTVTPLTGDWTRMSDGAQGLVHSVPLAVEQHHVQPDPKMNEYVRPLRLTVRNYLKQNDQTGALYVALSRLVRLEAIKDARPRTL